MMTQEQMNILRKVCERDPENAVAVAIIALLDSVDELQKNVGDLCDQIFALSNNTAGRPME